MVRTEVGHTEEEIDNMTEAEYALAFPIKEWIVTKTVTEYHVFTVEADTLEEAEAIADDDDVCYCDSHGASDTFVEVESVKERGDEV
jgi:hypothetical protein